ncbi:MAG: bacteriohemerythrin [Rhodospirillales bacterium]|jgi:hemerythrin-like metal-binding protein|nr:bacteriohemerythrin [Rhodospirillales bacterium]
MPLFEWSDDYETGIPDIDKDHKEIFSLINRLHDSPKKFFSQSEIEEVIARLLAYVRYHFEREENLLSVIGYGELESHAASHKALAKQMNDYAQLYRSYPEAFEMDKGLSQITHLGGYHGSYAEEPSQQVQTGSSD